MSGVVKILSSELLSILTLANRVSTRGECYELSAHIYQVSYD